VLPLACIAVAVLSLVLAPPVYRARAVVDLLPLEGATSAPDPSVLTGEAGRTVLESMLSMDALPPAEGSEVTTTDSDSADIGNRIDGFLASLSWSNVDGTPRYSILFDDPDPKQAVLGANLSARALEDILSPVPDETGVIRARLERIEAEIDNLRGQGGDLTLLRQRRSAAQQASISLGELYARARAARLDLESRWRALAQSTPSSMIDSFGSPRLVALRAERAHLLKRRDELSTRFGPRWPEIVELGEQIGAVEARMEAVASDLAEQALREAEADYRQALAHEREQDSLLKRQHEEILQLDQIEEQQVARSRLLDENQKERSELLAQLERPANPDAAAHVRIVLPASAPPARHGFSSPARLVLGVVVGLLLALLAQAIFWRLDPPLTSMADAEAALDAPFLACVPEIPGGAPPGPVRLESAPAPGTVGQVTPLAQAARGFRDLRTGLLLAQGGEAARVLLVTACRRGEGKTFVATHLALSLAQRGARVLLIDAHLRRPRAHRLFGVAPGPGLVDALSGRVRIEEAVRATKHAGLFFLPAGDVNGGSHELLDAASLRHLRDRLLQPTRFDHIVIDAGDINSAAAPERLVVACTGVLILVRARRTLARELRVSAATIRRHGISFLAGVWIGSEPSSRRVRPQDPEPVEPHAGGPETAHPTETAVAETFSGLQVVPAETGTPPVPEPGAQDSADAQTSDLDAEVTRRLELLRDRRERERGSA
jgi:capsular exopolysaccharide synthesis family protein